MRNVYQKDADRVKELQAIAKEKPVGKQLAKIIENINPTVFKKLIIITDVDTFTKVKVFKNKKTSVVLLYEKYRNEWIDIDTLEPQFRWDSITAIWNQLTEAIHNGI